MFHYTKLHDQGNHHEAWAKFLMLRTYTIVVLKGPTVEPWEKQLHFRFTLHSLICSSLGAPPWCPCQQHHLQQGFPAAITKEKVKQNIRKSACCYFCSSHPCKSNYFAILSASAFLIIFRSIIQRERKVKWVKESLISNKSPQSYVSKFLRS